LWEEKKKEVKDRWDGRKELPKAGSKESRVKGGVRCRNVIPKLEGQGRKKCWTFKRRGFPQLAKT